jgi:hypothetical protein
MPLKIDDINPFFIFTFIQTNISHKSYLHMQLQTTFLIFFFNHGAIEIVTSLVKKMVDLDTSCKCGSWNGQNSM